MKTINSSLWVHLSVNSSCVCFFLCARPSGNAAILLFTFKTIEESQNKDHGHQHEGAPPSGEKIFTDEELVTLIDPIMKQDDNNLDGYIDYPEFMRAQQRTAQIQADNARKPQQ